METTLAIINATDIPINRFFFPIQSTLTLSKKRITKTSPEITDLALV
jgi:hypothetical protein